MDGSSSDMTHSWKNLRSSERLKIGDGDVILFFLNTLGPFDAEQTSFLFIEKIGASTSKFCVCASVSLILYRLYSPFVRLVGVGAYQIGPCFSDAIEPRVLVSVFHNYTTVAVLHTA
jgi:hypothetical protein